ncbi:MAG: DUF6427 family protein [Flavobacteriaceae bacterium]
MSLLLSLIYLFFIFFVEKYSYSLPWLIDAVVKWVLLIGGLLVFKMTNIECKISRNSDFDILLYVILFSIFLISFSDNKLFYSYFFLLLSFRKMHSLFNDSETKSIVYDSGLWIGVATIFNPICSLYLLLLLYALVIFKKISWRFFLISIFGFITPLVLFHSYLFFINKNLSVFNFSFHFNITNYTSIQFILPLIGISIIVLLSLFKINRNKATYSLSVKRSLNIIFSHLGLTIIILFLFTDDLNGLMLLIYPISLIISNYLNLIQKKWFKNLIFYGILMIVFIIKIL